MYKPAQKQQEEELCLRVFVAKNPCKYRDVRQCMSQLPREEQNKAFEGGRWAFWNFNDRTQRVMKRLEKQNKITITKQGGHFVYTKI